MSNIEEGGKEERGIEWKNTNADNSSGRVLVPPLRFRVQRSKAFFAWFQAGRKRRETNELSAALFPVAPFEKTERRRFELEDRLRRQLRAFDVIGARNETIPATFNRSEEEGRLLPSQLPFLSRVV